MKWQQKHTTIVIIAAGFGLLYILFHKQWMLIPVGICIIGFSLSNVGEYIHLSWMALAKVLGFINSRIFLTVLFFLILTPIALFMRLFGKGNFVKSKNNSSLFITRNHLYSKADLQNPF
jgi:hypothetical protein